MTAEHRQQLNTPEFQKYKKDAEQGAATTVWAAISKDWEGVGGKYLENVSISEPHKESDARSGYFPHAYDGEGATQLWERSVKLVGLEE